MYHMNKCIGAYLNILYLSLNTDPESNTNGQTDKAANLTRRRGNMWRRECQETQQRRDVGDGYWMRNRWRGEVGMKKLGEWEIRGKKQDPMNGKVARLRLDLEGEVIHKGEDEVGEMKGRNETSKRVNERSRCVDHAGSGCPSSNSS